MKSHRTSGITTLQAALRFRRLSVPAAQLLVVQLVLSCASPDPQGVRWGNAIYIDLSIGESCEYRGRKVRLVSVDGRFCSVEVNGERRRLAVARRSLPEVIDGVRIFIADNKPVRNLTDDPEKHGLLTCDALLCLSDASQPLLDPDTYTFPISRRDGYEWHMEESSHMYAYLGLSTMYRRRFMRSHEGIDLNMHEASGKELHPLVALENGVIVSASPTGEKNQSCILMESASQPGVYYVYQHLHVRNVLVKEDQKVKKGDLLAYIWGDNVWGHLHFAVVHPDSVPQYDNRYTKLINCFPQLYELWHGDLEPREKIWTGGEFQFHRRRDHVQNRQRVHGYDTLIGYGWVLGDWCPAYSVEGLNDRKSGTIGNARLRKVLHTDSGRPADNPESHYDFEIHVENGTYRVRAQAGDLELPTWQRLSFEQQPAGEYALAAGQYQWTPEQDVAVADHRLTIRLELKNGETSAGLSEARFTRTGP